METATSPAKRGSDFSYFLTVIVATFVGMGLVAAAMPVSHVLFGERFHGDGQQAFGLVIMLTVYGFVAAFGYLAVVSVTHFVGRRKSLSARCWVEVGVFAAFMIALGSVGVTAHYP